MTRSISRSSVSPLAGRTASSVSAGSVSGDPSGEEEQPRFTVCLMGVAAVGKAGTNNI